MRNKTCDIGVVDLGILESGWPVRYSSRWKSAHSAQINYLALNYGTSHNLGSHCYIASNRWYHTFLTESKAPQVTLTSDHSLSTMATNTNL